MNIIASGVLGELPADFKHGLLGLAIALLIVATVGLLVTRSRNHKED